MAGKYKLKNRLGISRTPNVIVGSGEETPNTTVVSSTDKARSKRIVVYVIIALIILCAILVPVLHQRNSADKRQKLVSQAAPYLDPLAVDKLSPLIKQITTQQGYDHDASSLYVLTKYYVEISDAKNAQKYYDMLVKAYNPTSGYANSSLKDKALSPAQLKPLISVVQQQSTEAQNNFYGSPGETKNVQ
jgi:hypothetical protein